MSTQFTYYLPLGSMTDRKKNPAVFGTNAGDLELRAMLYAAYMKYLGNNEPKHYSDGTSMFFREDGTAVVRVCIDKRSIDL